MDGRRTSQAATGAAIDRLLYELHDLTLQVRARARTPDHISSASMPEGRPPGRPGVRTLRPDNGGDLPGGGGKIRGRTHRSSRTRMFFVIRAQSTRRHSREHGNPVFYYILPNNNLINIVLPSPTLCLLRPGTIP